MKLRKFFCLFLLAAGIGFGAAAQPYQKAFGLRVAPNSYYDLATASYKFFITEPGALELNAGFGTKSYSYGSPTTLSISASYQHHFEIPVRGGGLYWFIGGGLTGYRSFSNARDASGRRVYDGFGFGLFPTGGVDFKIPRIPLAVSVDYRPTFFVTSPENFDEFFGTNFGLSARYTFGN